MTNPSGRTSLKEDELKTSPTADVVVQRDGSKELPFYRKDGFKRVISGAVYAAVSMFCLLFGRSTTIALISAMAGLCAFEFYRMMHIDAKSPNDILGIIAAIAYPIVAFRGGRPIVVAVTLILMGALLIWYVFTPRVHIDDLALTVFGALYCGLMFSCLVSIRLGLSGLPGGILAFGVMLSVWTNDAFAYLFGSLFGKHKLAPKVSPHKSWEGFFAGLAGSIIVWLLLPYFIPTLSYPGAALAGLACGVIAVFGDFVESRIKRGAGVKDSGKIMPGHGGMLDRSDSLLFVSFIAYVVLLIEKVI